MPKTAVTGVDSSSNPVRIIKKYTNRRLYDTNVSRYITLNEIKDLVLSHNDFKVIDAKTQEDLTRVTLLQILMEEETNQQPILSSEILKEFMRFYGDSMQAMMSRFLEHSVNQFMQKKASFKSPLSTLLQDNSGSSMQSFTEQNADQWLSNSSQPKKHKQNYKVL
jgi:polyhydroxyalkanoate synthesis repressor PhaR